MKKLILTIALAAMAVGVSAQEWEKYDTSAGTYERTTKRGPYLTNRFFDNMFIGIGGGVNIYNGKFDSKADFGDRIAASAELSLGKWLTPSTGVRVQVTGIKAKGLSGEATNFTKSTPNKKDYYKKEFNVLNTHADFLWNISHAIGGYKSERTWNFVPFMGFGFARAWKSDVESNYEFTANVGLLNTIRLGGVVDLTLEGKYMFVKPRFDNFPGGRKIDGMTSVTAGLTFKLGPKGGFKRPMAVAPADYTPYNKRIGTLEDELAAEKARADKLAKDLEAANNRPQPKPETVVAPVSTTVFFKIGQAFLTDKDMVNLENIAKTMKATPDKKYTVTGYADAGTGSAQRNEIISRQRAESVKKALVEKFGVNESQLNVVAGGGVKHSKNPELDRSAFVVIE